MGFSYGRYKLIAILLLLIAASANGQNKTKNAILITLDGVRTQEIFAGLDLDILKAATKKGAVEETPLYKKYWAATAEQRRYKVMPFFWGDLMKQNGSIAGNRSLGSTIQITNSHRFSYPGYSEILTGQAHDDVVKSNNKIRNPNPTVLEFLKRKLRLKTDQVASFASWDVFDWIVESKPGTITSNAGYESYVTTDSAIKDLSRNQFETVTPWDSVRNDFYTFRFAMSHLKTHRPRVLYLALGETDDWAHDNRYDRVLQTLTRTDEYLRELWEFVQNDKQYKDKTTIIITTDHGRGLKPADWFDHGDDVEGAQYIWLATFGPDSGLRGEWNDAPTIYQNQIAATLCRFLGLDYSEQNPNAGKAIGKLFSDRN
ncbi:MAG: alkaline phosphatase family protein [Pyrinomonadaceae bacterium]